MPFTARAVTLSEQERGELEQMIQSRTLPAGDVFRARLILLLAEGLPYRIIQERLDTTAPTISRWRRRFEEQRVKWRLTEEASCMIETAFGLPSHTLLRLTVGRTVGDIKYIRVETGNSDRPLVVWAKAGPYDSRSVVTNETHALRVQINLLRHRKAYRC